MTTHPPAMDSLWERMQHPTPPPAAAPAAPPTGQHAATRPRRTRRVPAESRPLKLTDPLGALGPIIVLGQSGVWKAHRWCHTGATDAVLLIRWEHAGITPPPMQRWFPLVNEATGKAQVHLVTGWKEVDA